MPTPTDTLIDAERQRELQALRDSFSQDPWHARQAAETGPRYWELLHASCPNASFRRRSLPRAAPGTRADADA